MHRYARRLRIWETDFGRDSGWVIERQGETIAILTEWRSEEMFWDSYLLEIVAADSGLRGRCSQRSSGHERNPRSWYGAIGNSATLPSMLSRASRRFLNQVVSSCAACIFRLATRGRGTGLCCGFGVGYVEAGANQSLNLTGAAFRQIKDPTDSPITMERESRPDAFGVAGDLCSPLVKKDPHHQQGSFLSAQAGIFPTGQRRVRSRHMSRPSPGVPSPSSSAHVSAAPGTIAA